MPGVARKEVLFAVCSPHRGDAAGGDRERATHGDRAAADQVPPHPRITGRSLRFWRSAIERLRVAISEPSTRANPDDSVGDQGIAPLTGRRMIGFAREESPGSRPAEHLRRPRLTDVRLRRHASASLPERPRLISFRFGAPQPRMRSPVSWLRRWRRCPSFVKGEVSCGACCRFSRRSLLGEGASQRVSSDRPVVPMQRGRPTDRVRLLD
jgi:hypothetical protein